LKNLINKEETRNPKRGAQLKAGKLTNGKIEGDANQEIRQN